jgi:hypothetical protein
MTKGKKAERLKTKAMKANEFGNAQRQKEEDNVCNACCGNTITCKWQVLGRKESACARCLRHKVTCKVAFNVFCQKQSEYLTKLVSAIIIAQSYW